MLLDVNSIIKFDDNGEGNQKQGTKKMFVKFSSGIFTLTFTGWLPSITTYLVFDSTITDYNSLFSLINMMMMCVR